MKKGQIATVTAEHSPNRGYKGKITDIYVLPEDKTYKLVVLDDVLSVHPEDITIEL